MKFSFSPRSSCCCRGGTAVTLIPHPPNSLLVECPEWHPEHPAAVEKQLRPERRGAQAATSRLLTGDTNLFASASEPGGKHLSYLYSSKEQSFILGLGGLVRMK